MSLEIARADFVAHVRFTIIRAEHDENSYPTHRNRLQASEHTFFNRPVSWRSDCIMIEQDEFCDVLAVFEADANGNATKCLYLDIATVIRRSSVLAERTKLCMLESTNGKLDLTAEPEPIRAALFAILRSFYPPNQLEIEDHLLAPCCFALDNFKIRFVFFYILIIFM
jgi:hypothetical protein